MSCCPPCPPCCPPSCAIPSCAARPTVGLGGCGTPSALGGFGGIGGYGGIGGFGGYGSFSSGSGPASASSLGTLAGVTPSPISQIPSSEVVIQPPAVVLTLPGPILAASCEPVAVGGYSACAAGSLGALILVGCSALAQGASVAPDANSASVVHHAKPKLIREDPKD